ncbi:MAG: NAD+ synthase [Pseudomonadota bacterium]
MTDTLKIALAQLNVHVGDIRGNTMRILDAYEEAKAKAADLLVCPELCLIGYPPEDLVLKPAFQQDAVAAVEYLAKMTMGQSCGLIVSTCWPENENLYNSLCLLFKGRIEAIIHKHDLPNYGVFDEKRIFASGDPSGPVSFKGVRLGLMTCEDMWFPDVTETLAETGAEILIAPHGSPFDVKKEDARLSNAVARVCESGLPLIFVNQVGGQDELVFDGDSFILNADRSRPVILPDWEELTYLTEWQRGGDGAWACQTTYQGTQQSDLASIYQAMMLGLRDYVEKNRFPGVVLGMSGGIDSALSAVVAADALGPDRVHCVMMPSRYTSDHSLEDAKACAEACGARYETIAIGPAVDAFTGMFADSFAGLESDITEENMQSRIRGLILMGLSNKHGNMVLTTGNKSEMSVGYATLYGDMCGGYSVLKDIYKMTVFELCRWRNANMPINAKGRAGAVIPERIITKPPSAELREDQKDEDSLPPYEALDDILHGLVEQELSVEDIAARGHAPELVRRIEHLLFIAEYKRRQSPPGVKISSKAFGRDRRYPITNGFRDGAGPITFPDQKAAE